MRKSVFSAPNSLLAEVSDAWTQTVPAAAFGPVARWGDTGADSLETLTFVLRLERKLGRQIPLELVTPDMTAPALAAAIAQHPSRVEDERDPVFLVPGQFGDSPALGLLRLTLKRLRFEMLALPDLDEPASALGDFEAISRRIADDIGRRRPEGPILLAGYSFGANIAYEAAAELARRGRSPAFVGLMDPVPPEADEAAGRPWAEGGSRPRRLAGRMAGWRARLSPRGESPSSYAEWLAFLLLVRMGATEAARRLARRRLAEPELYLRRRNHLLRFMRAQALRRWRPEALPAFSLLVTGTSFAAHPGSTLWDTLLPEARRLELAVRHEDLLGPGTIEKLAAEFEEAVIAAVGPGLPPPSRRG
jgi:thioesterase domain-containing protein